MLVHAIQGIIGARGNSKEPLSGKSVSLKGGVSRGETGPHVDLQMRFRRDALRVTRYTYWVKLLDKPHIVALDPWWLVARGSWRFHDIKDIFRPCSAPT